MSAFTTPINRTIYWSIESNTWGWKLLGKALAAAGREHEAVDAWSHGIDAAQTRGDVQAAREMEVFRRRAQRAIDRGD